MPKFKEYLADMYPNVSLESLGDGVTNREIEHTIYTELHDFDELKRRAVKVERHEQWLIPLDKDKQRTEGKMRIRLIDDARGTMCIKTVPATGVGFNENELDIPLETFRTMRALAIDGYIKTRYTVPSNINGLVWEIDVFLGKGGQPHPWVKVDLEVKSLDDPIPTFPLAHGAIILGDGELTMAEQIRLRKLWEEEWSKLDP